jgi:hypothetical protein
MTVVLFKERIECAMPARMMYAVAHLKAFVFVDSVEGPARLKQMQELLQRACFEPLEGLNGPVARVLGSKVDKLHADVMGEYENQRADKVAAAVFYFLKDLTDSGYLELWEGSPVAQAAELYVPMIEHVFEEHKLDESAQKQARRILAKLQEKGYYV